MATETMSPVQCVRCGQASHAHQTTSDTCLRLLVARVTSLAAHVERLEARMPAPAALEWQALKEQAMRECGVPIVYATPPPAAPTACDGECVGTCESHAGQHVKRHDVMDHQWPAPCRAWRCSTHGSAHKVAPVVVPPATPAPAFVLSDVEAEAVARSSRTHSVDAAILARLVRRMAEHFGVSLDAREG